MYRMYKKALDQVSSKAVAQEQLALKHLVFSLWDFVAKKLLSILTQTFDPLLYARDELKQVKIEMPKCLHQQIKMQIALNLKLYMR